MTQKRIHYICAIIAIIILILTLCYLVFERPFSLSTENVEAYDIMYIDICDNKYGEHSKYVIYNSNPRFDQIEDLIVNEKFKKPLNLFSKAHSEHRFQDGDYQWSIILSCIDNSVDAIHIDNFYGTNYYWTDGEIIRCKPTDRDWNEQIYKIILCVVNNE